MIILLRHKYFYFTKFSTNKLINLMSKRNWLYLNNPFLTVTEGNYRLAYELSTFHQNALQANSTDAFISTIRSAYEPLHSTLTEAYNTWKTQVGQKAGKTLSISQLLDQTKSKLDVWEPAIMVLYPKTTPEYRAILPQGRKPFTNGAKDSRIAAFASLEKSLQGIAVLETTRNSVLDFWQQLHSAHNEQQGSVAQTDQHSLDVEAARVAAMTQLFANFNKLLGEHPANPELVATYIDVQSMRRIDQSMFTGQLDADETHEIFKHKFNLDDMLEVTNASDSATLELYFTNGLKTIAEAGTPKVTLAAGQELTFAVTDANYADDRRYLYIHNTSIGNGIWELQIL
jgi:hypothetical protein